MNDYSFELKVCTPYGKRIGVKVTQLNNGQNKIETEYLEAIEKDNPPKSRGGKMIFFYDRIDHKKVIKRLENYIESLMLKELAKDDNKNTIEPIRSKPRRTKKSVVTEPDSESEREKSGGIHDSGTGDE